MDEINKNVALLVSVLSLLIGVGGLYFARQSERASRVSALASEKSAASAEASVRIAQAALDLQESTVRERVELTITRDPSNQNLLLYFRNRGIETAISGIRLAYKGADGNLWGCSFRAIGARDVTHELPREKRILLTISDDDARTSEIRLTVCDGFFVIVELASGAEILVRDVDGMISQFVKECGLCE